MDGWMNGRTGRTVADGQSNDGHQSASKSNTTDKNKMSADDLIAGLPVYTWSNIGMTRVFVIPYQHRVRCLPKEADLLFI